MATTSSQEPQEPTLKCAVAAIPSAPSPIEALVPFPLSKQLHKPSPKSSDTATLFTKAPSAIALTDFAAHDSYLKAIKEMYPQTNMDQLSINMAFHEDWATIRATAALIALTEGKRVITDKKLVYYDRTSLSDYDDSDASVASYMQKKPKKKNLDDEDKKFFTCIPTCYAIFFAFNSKDAVESYCPFAKHNKCWKEKNSLESGLL